MSEKIEVLQKLVADLAVLNVKVHNLHWNVVGENFKPVHEQLEGVYDTLFEQYDEVAERIKMLGGFPLASLRSYLEKSSIEEMDSHDISIRQAFEIAKNDLSSLRETALHARKLADQEDDPITVALLEDHVTDLDKHIWLVSQALKNA